MVNDLKIATWAYSNMPDMGVEDKATPLAYIISSSFWKPYLEENEIEIMTNFISHETAHLKLYKLGQRKANYALDNFLYPMTSEGKVDDKKHREMEVAENTGLELLIMAVEKRDSDRNNSVTKVYKESKRG
jgi:hypothetical protein